MTLYFAENVAALEQAQPKDLSAAEIDVRIGVTWIDPQYYTQFVHELLKPPFYLKKDIQVRYSPGHRRMECERKIAGQPKQFPGLCDLRNQTEKRLRHH